MADIPHLFESYETLLTAKLAQARAALSHSGQKGSLLENAVRDVLEIFLPQKIGVTEGIIIDSSGFVSNQIDIILFDRQKAHLFMNSDHTKVIPAEYVYAVGEIKAQLTPQGYDRFEEVQKKIKLSKRNFRPGLFPKPHYNGYGKKWSIFPIASFVFCFEGNAKTIYQKSITSHANNPVNLCVDTIICPGQFHIRRASEYGADLYQGKMVSLDSVTEHTLHAFLGMLAKAAQYWHIYEDVEIYRYYMQFDGIPNSLITNISSTIAQHPDIID